MDIPFGVRARAQPKKPYLLFGDSTGVSSNRQVAEGALSYARKGPRADDARC